MTKAELDAVRAKIANDPEDSPARVLLAEIDRMNEASHQRATADIRNRLLREDCLTEAEAEKVMTAMFAGKMPEFERGPCRACDGHGRESVPGCMGSRLERCRKCNGRGTTTRIKVPNEEALADTPKPT